MLTPEYLLRVSEGAEEIADYLHTDIINRITERMLIRINRGEKYLLTSYDKWQIETLQEAGFLAEDIQKEISKRTKQQETEIKEAFEDAGVKTLEYDDKIYRDAGLSPVPLWESPYMVRMMQRNYEATLGEWNNFTRTIADSSQTLFITEMDKAYNLVASGAVSYTQAFLEAINNVVDKGVTVKYHPSEHEDTIETATLRCVRTGISQMSGQITNARMDEMNWDIILVSSHLGARHTGTGDFKDHQHWQGKFYSKSGNDKRFPPYSECGEGEVQGIHGANCRHSHGPGDGVHNPFEEYDTEENKKVYETTQKQRSYERNIRQSKRKVLNLKNDIDNTKDEKLKFELDMKYQREASLLQKRNARYKEFCKENNLKELDERLAIAKWDRQQDASARGAARRYQNAHGGSDLTKENNIIIKPKTVDELSKRTTKALENAYENHRITNDTSAVPLKELGENHGVINANYGNLSMESATAFSNTIENLMQEYDTPLTSIRPMRKEEYFQLNGSFASVSHDYTSDTSELVINVTKCKDYDKLVGRINDLADDGYFAKVLPEKADAYVATHEFSHTIINMQNKLNNKTNWVNANYDKIRSARKEIEDLYKSYMHKLSDIDYNVKDYESKMFEYMMNGQEIPVEIENLYNKYYDDYQGLIISEYSLANSDEFMAEAFTEGKIGIKKSEYSQKVLDVIDKYFKR